MKITFDQDSARDYAATHGHAPRGYGQWAFALGRPDGAWTEVHFTGNYSDVKKEAIREARNLGCTVVVVAS